MKDVESAIISHEQTQSNRVCCFQTLDAVFPKDLYSDYLEHSGKRELLGDQACLPYRIKFFLLLRKKRN